MRVDKELSNYIESREGQEKLNEQVRRGISVAIDSGIDRLTSEGIFNAFYSSKTSSGSQRIGDKVYHFSMQTPSAKELLGIKKDDFTRDEVMSAIASKFGTIEKLKDRMALEAALAVQEGRFTIKRVL